MHGIGYCISPHFRVARFSEENQFGPISGNWSRTKLLARKAMMVPASSCDGSMISTTQDNPRDGLILPLEDPIVWLQMLSRARMQTVWGGHRKFMLGMTWEESQEKTVVNKQITDQEFPAEASALEKVYNHTGGAGLFS